MGDDNEDDEDDDQTVKPNPKPGASKTKERGGKPNDNDNDNNDEDDNNDDTTKSKSKSRPQKNSKVNHLNTQLLVKRKIILINKGGKNSPGPKDSRKQGPTKSTTTDDNDDNDNADDEDDDKDTTQSPISTSTSDDDDDDNNDENCTKPSINDFPSDLFTQTQRRFGGVLFHIAFAVYLFFAIMIVCDDYFMTSLEIIGQVTLFIRNFIPKSTHIES